MPRSTKRPHVLFLSIIACLLPTVILYSLKRPIVKVLWPYEPFRHIYRSIYYKWLFPPVLLTPDEVGDGKHALEIILQHPVAMAVDALGRVYITDRGRYVWRVEPDGTAHIVAGSGKMDSVPARVGARDVRLESPEGLCLDEAGNLYFADRNLSVVLKLDTRGMITRVAGNGWHRYDGDGRPAVNAALNRPYGVALDSTGNLYIADFGNDRIRRVDPHGRISTVAGTGAAGYSGDGGPAVEARLNGPYGVFVDADDNLLIPDSLNHVIRKVGPDGKIRTIAGTGARGYSGDGGPALAATFDTPESLFADAQGRLYIGDENNHSIRVIDTDGTISTLVGNGQPGDSADGTVCDRAQLNKPEGLWVGHDGTILITEGNSQRVRVILPGGCVMGTFAGKGPQASGVGELGGRVREKPPQSAIK